MCACALLVLGSATLSSSRAQKMTVSSSLGGHKGTRASDCQRRGEYRRELQRRRGGFVGERPLQIAREEALNQRGRRNKRVGETREQVSVGERRVEVSHHHFLQPPVLVFRELDDVVFEERRAQGASVLDHRRHDDQTKKRTFKNKRRSILLIFSWIRVYTTRCTKGRRMPTRTS